MIPWSKTSWRDIGLAAVVVALAAFRWVGSTPAVLVVALVVGVLAGWWISVVPGIGHTLRDVGVGMALAALGMWKGQLPAGWWPYALVGGGVLGWLLGCAIFPKRRCWWCSGMRFWGDGSGNLRDRGCWRCGGVGTVVRVGARPWHHGS